MIETSSAYKAAITADSRRMLLKAVIDIIDPDITFGTATSSGSAPWSKPEQLHDKVFCMDDPFITLERNRWILNGKLKLLPNDVAAIDRQVGFVGNVVSRDDGTFSENPWVQLNFSNVDILQACSIFFSDRKNDGLAKDFTVEVLQGGTAYYTKSFTGNTEQRVSLEGFTVYNPDAIKVTVTKWSLPGRRIRIPEILPGVYEEWDNDIIAHFDVKQQGDVSCMALPYGTCVLRMDNLDRRFDPRNKDGIFKSIEDRQGIDVKIGTRTPGGDEFVRVGMFYQDSGGWKTSDNNLTMEWNLVDIVGLVANREYIPSATLSTTLDGWVKSIVSQLGTNFQSKYTVDANYSSLTVSVNSVEDIIGMNCGDVLRYVCMATGTWPRADAETGYLTVEPMWSQGNKQDLDNLNVYPTMKANDDLAAIVFTLFDGSDTQYVVSGNTTTSSATKSVKNPFIHTQAQALTAARNILSTYGGNRLETVGRGNPSSEIGDVETVELDESNATTGRKIYQTFVFQDGVMQGCQSVLLQADGSFLFENREVITQSGTWTAPAGVSQLRLIIGNGGDSGTDGTDGTWEEAGLDGLDGVGGKVFSTTISINEQQSFNVVIGAGGVNGGSGGETTFGAYSGNSGRVFSPSYTDIASGDAFGRTGVVAPLDGTGDGGARGKGGVKGNKRIVTKREEDEEGNVTTTWETAIDNYPGNGTNGKNGADGFVVICWDKEAEA